MSQQTALATDFRFLRIGLWSGPVYAIFGLIGFAVLAGFWPPPGADLSAEQIGAIFRDRNTAMRTGLVMMAFAGPFYFVWSAVISKIVQRIEGPMGVLSSVELLGGLLTALVTFTPAVIWLTASLRPETRSVQEVQLLYDFGWMYFDLTFVCSVLQSVALGLAILIDRRTKPLFPNWVAWICFLTAASYCPLVFMPFFKTGPFAWQGLISFWVVFVMFFVMLVIVTLYAFPALRRLEAEMSTPLR